MRINVLFREQNEVFDSNFLETDETIDVGFESAETLQIGTRNYNKLINRPSINSVELVGALTAEDLGLGRVYYDTTANWERQAGLVGIRGAVYIYSDYSYLEDGAGNSIPIAGIRIGDGNSYIRDLPFISDAMTNTIVAHISDNDRHVTLHEKEFWNNKVSSFLGGTEGETLILSKTHYEVNGNIVAG